MRNIFIAIAMVLLVGCSSQKEKVQTDKKISIYYNYGTQNLIQGNYTLALKYLIKAAELDPKNSTIHNNLGMAYFFKNNKSLARKHVEEAIKLDPENIDAKSNLASFYFDEGKLNLARKHYREILKQLTYTKQHQVYYNLGKIDLKENKTDAAIKNFKLAIKENPNSCGAYFQIGKVLFDKKDYKKALPYFKKSYDGVCYKNPEPLYYQGLALIEMNRLDMAKLKFMELEDRFPKSSLVTLSKEKMIEMRNYSSFTDDKYFSRLQEVKRQETKPLKAPEFED